MKVLVIGATGYVGSHVISAFAKRGHDVTGLARNEANVQSLSDRGYDAELGDINDFAAIGALAGRYDIVAMAGMLPFETEYAFMRALADGCAAGQTHHLLFTSGSGVLSIESKDGSWSQYTFAEDDPFPFPERENRAFRIRTEAMVREAGNDRLSTYVIRPPLIYGNGGSIQIPQIFESARRTGSACYLGLGLNLYSAVHVEDLAEVYCLAVEKGTSGALYHTVSGEANFRTIAEAVASVVGCGTTSLNYEAACELWGPFWVDIALAVNSRSIARRTVEELGWVPAHLDVIDDVRNGSYAEKYRAGLSSYSWKSHG